MKKTIYNLIYQSIFQLTKIILPIITIPIVSKALGPSGIGVYNYTNSIAQYFVLIAGLGVGVYGNREIAIVRDDKDALSQKFWELFGMSFFISLVSFIFYIIIVSFSNERFYFYLQSLIIVAAIFDVSWFFMGVEDFKKTSLSSLTAQIISFLGIVLFVKSSKDLWIYILLQSSNILVSQGIMWIFIWEKIKFRKIKFKDMVQHVLPSLNFFIPKIAIVLYTNLNKTLLGWLDTADAVGYYSNTLILTGVLVTLVTTLDMVLLPKFSNLVAKGETKVIVKVMNKTIDVQLFFTIPMMFGIWAIVPKLVPWFFGKNFSLLIKTIPIVAPLVVIMPLGMAVGRQYLVPMNRIKIYNIAVITGSFVSILTNIILIPIIGMYGAIIATILSELFVTATRFISFIKETDFHLKAREILHYCIAGVVMYIVILSLTAHMKASFLTTFLQGLLGIVIYMIVTVIFKSNPLLKLIKNRGFDD